jgi:hypothetical protein
MVIFYEDKNNNNKIDFRFDNNNKIDFRFENDQINFDCLDQLANIRYKGNIFYRDKNIVDGRQSYRALNGYVIAWAADYFPGINVWIYSENTPGTDLIIESEALYPWEIYPPFEKYCF